MNVKENRERERERKESSKQMKGIIELKERRKAWDFTCSESVK